MVSEEVNPFGIPKLFIFGTVASGLVFGVVVGLTLIICKHKKVYYHSFVTASKPLMQRFLSPIDQPRLNYGLERSNSAIANVFQQIILASRRSRGRIQYI